MRASQNYLMTQASNQFPWLPKVLFKNFITNQPYKLSALYVLKDQLKLVYYYSDQEEVKKILDDWCEMAGQIEHSSVKAFIKRLRFFEYGILNHADCGRNDFPKLIIFLRRFVFFNWAHYSFFLSCRIDNRRNCCETMQKRGIVEK